MGLRDKPRRAPKEPQGILPFEYQTTGEPEDVTARAGLPLVAETMQMLAVGELVSEHVHIRQRQSGYSEAWHSVLPSACPNRPERLARSAAPG